MPDRDVILHLPKFKLEPPSLSLGEALRGLGMMVAFDQPRGSADFGRMAPRKPNDYLCISEVIHKTWLSLDENGTEAAAATAVIMATSSMAPGYGPQPFYMEVNRPFFFAITDDKTGEILFMGAMNSV